WSMPHDPEAWPDTGQVMNAQEAAVAFNALIDRLAQVDKLARELAEKAVQEHEENISDGCKCYKGYMCSSHVARQLLKLYEEEKP
ncbi:hypothetical protein LCGC14_1295110, partial [marine sediment metagenome]